MIGTRVPYPLYIEFLNDYWKHKIMKFLSEFISRKTKYSYEKPIRDFYMDSL